MNLFSIRKIEPTDNNALSKIIRDALTEFKANKPGTVYFDDSTDHLFELFQQEKGIYNVAIDNNQILGGGGIVHTSGLAPDTCELVKLYLSPAARGKGIGRALMQQCIDEAKKAGYKKVYLETMPELISAIPLYEKFGFSYLSGPLGNSGHTGCDIWMIKLL